MSDAPGSGDRSAGYDGADDGDAGGAYSSLRMMPKVVQSTKCATGPCRVGHVMPTTSGWTTDGQRNSMEITNHDKNKTDRSIDKVVS